MFMSASITLGVCVCVCMQVNLSLPHGFVCKKPTNCDDQFYFMNISTKSHLVSRSTYIQHAVTMVAVFHSSLSAGMHEGIARICLRYVKCHHYGIRGTQVLDEDSSMTASVFHQALLNIPEALIDYV